MLKGLRHWLNNQVSNVPPNHRLSSVYRDLASMASTRCYLCTVERAVIGFRAENSWSIPTSGLQDVDDEYGAVLILPDDSTMMI